MPKHDKKEDEFWDGPEHAWAEEQGYGEKGGGEEQPRGGSPETPPRRRPGEQRKRAPSTPPNKQGQAHPKSPAVEAEGFVQRKGGSPVPLQITIPRHRELGEPLTQSPEAGYNTGGGGGLRGDTGALV